jgi:hypothetical protein
MAGCWPKRGFRKLLQYKGLHFFGVPQWLAVGKNNGVGLYLPFLEAAPLAVKG